MPVEYGEAYAACACGCGTEMRERIYRAPSGRVNKRRRPPTLLNHHRRLIPKVSGHVLAQHVRNERVARRLTWAKMGILLGYSYDPQGQSLQHVVMKWERTNVVRRDVAERTLRRLAGLPTLPTRVERGAQAKVLDSAEDRHRARVLDHAAKSGDVAATCRVFGISRTTFYRWQAKERKAA